MNTLPDYWVENRTVGARVGPEVSKDLAGVWSRQGMMVVQAGDNGGSGQREQWGRMDLGNVLKSGRTG